MHALNLPDEESIAALTRLIGRLVRTEKGFEVNGDLDLSGTKITSLPDNVHVSGNLDLRHTPIAALPDNLRVGGDLYLTATNVTVLPCDLRVGGRVYYSKDSLLPNDVDVAFARACMRRDATDPVGDAPTPAATPSLRADGSPSRPASSPKMD